MNAGSSAVARWLVPLRHMMWMVLWDLLRSSGNTSRVAPKSQFKSNFSLPIRTRWAHKTNKNRTSSDYAWNYTNEAFRFMQDLWICPLYARPRTTTPCNTRALHFYLRARYNFVSATLFTFYGVGTPLKWSASARTNNHFPPFTHKNISSPLKFVDFPYRNSEHFFFFFNSYRSTLVSSSSAWAPSNFCLNLYEISFQINLSLALTLAHQKIKQTNAWNGNAADWPHRRIESEEKSNRKDFVYLWFENLRLANCTIIKNYNKHGSTQRRCGGSTTTNKTIMNMFNFFGAHSFNVGSARSKSTVFISFNNSIELCAHFFFIKIYGNLGRP